jgi:hypothetical protein
MLFHDTNEFRAGFGVHQFWSEVEVQYPSFHFLHAHGLGVLGVGSDLDPRVREMFEMLNDETDVHRRSFSALGDDIKRRYNLESKPQRIEELESRVAEVTKALAAEERRREDEQLRLAEKQRELRAARRALSEVLESTSWKVSAPVRAVGSLFGRGRRS